jgi:outer membrane receptor for ferrienterochelin and colicins
MKYWIRSKLTAAVLLSTLPAAADPTTNELEAILEDPVVSTPSMASGSASVAPATSTSITAEDLRAHGIRTLDEAINYASLGMVTTPSMHSVEIGSRGVLMNLDYGNHVLLLINGLAVNEPWEGTAYFERGAGIPFDLVDHIEVMLGPGSVLYGSQAMLGVINIVTKRAQDYKGAHLFVDGELAAPQNPKFQLRRPSSGGYLGDLGKGYRVGAGYGGEFRLWGVPSELTFQIEHYAFSGAAIDFTPQDYGADSVTGAAKRFGPGAGTGIWGGRGQRSWFTSAPTSYAEWRVGDFALTSRIGQYKRSAPYNDAAVRYFGDFDPPNDHETDRFYDLNLRHEKAMATNVTVKSRLFAQQQNYQWFLSSSAPEDCSPGQSTGCRYDLSTTARRLGAEVRSSINWQNAWFMATEIGVTGQLRHVTSRTIPRSSLGDGPAFGSMNNADLQGALFVEQTARPLRPLDVNLGARYDSDERFGSRLSPRGALAFTSWQGATWKTLYAEAFRAPSAYELYYEDPLVQVTAPALRPETTRTVEGSFEQRIGAQRFFFGVFRSWWMDMVALEVLTPEQQQAYVNSGELSTLASYAMQYRNVSRIDNWGFNAAYGLGFWQNRLRFDVNVTGARTTVGGGGQYQGPPTVTPQFFGNARVTLRLPNNLPTVGIATAFRGQQFGDRYYDGGFSRPPVAPGSWELRGTVSGAVPLAQGLGYRLSVTYNQARFAPYNIGAVQYASDATTPAHLAPVNRLYGFAGLQYDFSL